jgi:hypothetical protein
MNSKKIQRRPPNVVEQLNEINEKIQLSLVGYFARHWMTIAKVIGAARFAGH